MSSSTTKALAARQTDGGQWSVRPEWPGRGELAQVLRVPELVGQLLYNRGISEVEQARQYLQPAMKDLIEPTKLLGIEKAVKRIRQGLSEGQKITLYGDYDVDGIMGVSILWQCLKLAGSEVDYYVPHRLDEGYGLNVEAVQELAKKGTKLIITVDCGVTAHESADLAAQLGVDLIITDHHKIEEKTAQAVAVVHPDLPGQDYANKNLCGAGVAFKLAWALCQDFSGSMKVSDEFRQFLISAMSMVALATIADIVPLQGENRILARFGLGGLAASSDVGIRALMKAAGFNGNKLSSSDVGFRLAPRLNAAGRMGHARLAVEMFTKSSESKAQQIAAYLESQNKQRQKVEKEITAQAIQQVEQLGMDKKKWRGIVLADEGWHGGVIGIVASRIVDKYHRPTIVVSMSPEESRGSCRSIQGFDIHKALQGCSEHLLSYGGHEMAAGLTVETGKIDDLRKAFNQYACDNISDGELVKTLDIDAEVSLDQLDLSCVSMIERLGPFGQGNPSVRLVARGLKLVEPPRRIGKKGDHLALVVTDKENSAGRMAPGSMMRGVAFGKAKWLKKLIDAQSFDVVFEPIINRFNGNETVEMMIKDFRTNN